MHTLIQIWVVVILFLGIGEMGKLLSKNEFYFNILSRFCIAFLIGSVGAVVLAWALIG